MGLRVYYLAVVIDKHDFYHFSRFYIILFLIWCSLSGCIGDSRNFGDLNAVRYLVNLRVLTHFMPPLTKLYEVSIYITPILIVFKKFEM